MHLKNTCLLLYSLLEETGNRWGKRDMITNYFTDILNMMRALGNLSHSV